VPTFWSWLVSSTVHDRAKVLMVNLTDFVVDNLKS
jgi:hypothetical protein